MTCVCLNSFELLFSVEYLHGKRSATAVDSAHSAHDLILSRGPDPPLLNRHESHVSPATMVDVPVTQFAAGDRGTVSTGVKLQAAAATRTRKPVGSMPLPQGKAMGCFQGIGALARACSVGGWSSGCPSRRSIHRSRVAADPALLPTFLAQD